MFGFDIGTGNLVIAREIDNKISVNSFRNMYYKFSENEITEKELETANINYITFNRDGEKSIILIGEDAFRLSAAFGKSVSRPMKNGLINSGDIDSIDIMTLIIKKMIELDDVQDEDKKCSFSVPDFKTKESLKYHEKVVQNIFKKLGYKAYPVNEAMCVIYSEAAAYNFSGIGISFGAGLTNIAYSYKSIPAIQFAIDIGGDWIDTYTAKSVNKLETRITKVKETSLDLNEFPVSGKADEKRIKESLILHYEELIRRVLDEFMKEFNLRSENIEIDENVPIILSGGTSMVKGFVDKFKEIFYESYEKKFPFTVSEIKHASEPLYAVVLGALIHCKNIEDE